MCCINEPIKTTVDRAYDHALKLFLGVQLTVNISAAEPFLHPPLSVNEEVMSIRPLDVHISLIEPDFYQSQVYEDRLLDGSKRLLERWVNEKRLHIVRLSMEYEVINNLASKVPSLDDIKKLRDCAYSLSDEDLEVKQTIFDPWVCFLLDSLRKGDSEMEQSMLLELEQADYGQICELYVDFAKVKFHTHKELSKQAAEAAARAAAFQPALQ